MDKVIDYRQIIEQVIEDYAQLVIEDDRTEEGIANSLVESGILEEDIRLAWADSPTSKDEMSLVA